MNKFLHNKFSIFIIAFTILMGAYGTMTLNTGRDKIAANNFELISSQAVTSINSEMLRLKEELSNLAADISSTVYDPSMIKDIDQRNKLTNDISWALKHILERSKYDGTTYLRWAPDLTNDNSGLFFVRRDNDVKNMVITDIFAFDPSDLSHVGWYYIPIKHKTAMWMSPYYNDNIDMNMISYVVPIYNNSTAIGLVGIDIDMDALINDVSSLELYTSGFATISDNSGNVLNDNNIEIKDMYSSSFKLDNNMTITAYVPNNEVLNKSYTPLTIILCVAYVICLLLYVIRIILGSNTKVTTAERNAAKRSRNFLKYAFIFAIIATLLFQLIFALQKIRFSPVNSFIATATNDYDKTINVVADKDCSPYSFISNDSATGHEIELINELANRLKVNINVALLPRAEAIEAVTNGSADIMLGYSTSDSSSLAIIATSDTVVDDYLVVFGKKPIDNVLDLFDKKLAIVAGSQVKDSYGLSNIATPYSSCTTALEAVENGSCEYAIVCKSAALSAIKSNNYKDLIQVHELMTIHIGIGVKSSNQILLSQINQNLKLLKSEGFLDDLKSKWIDYYVEDASPLLIMRANRVFFIITSIFVIICIIGLALCNYYAKKAELRIKFETDALTNIKNRGGGERYIEAFLSDGVPGLFCFFDVDKFKDINDTYGHKVGDLVLIEIGKCLRETFRDDDIVMRLGGDEFVAFAIGITSENAGISLINRLFQAINNIDIPELKGHKISISLGATLSNSDVETDFDSLYQKSDSAVYESKKEAGNYYTFVS